MTLPRGTRCSLNHGGSLLAVLVAFSHLQFSQIRGRQPYSIVRNIPYVIVVVLVEGDAIAFAKQEIGQGVLAFFDRDPAHVFAV